VPGSNANQAHIKFITASLPRPTLLPFQGKWLTLLQCFRNGHQEVAIRRTFEQRKTELPQSIPTAFTPSFYDDKTKQTQWQAFMRKGLGTSETPTLTVVANAIYDFLMPVTEALKRGESFTRQWEQGGPWQ